MYFEFHNFFKREKNKSYNLSLQGLRGFAIILVVLYHLDFPFLSGGYIGVDIFFCLSGFLITKILTEKLSFKDFIKNRFYRLMPTLVLAVCFTIIFGFLFYTSVEYEKLAKTSLSSIFFVSNYFMMFDDLNYFSNIRNNYPLLHTWSLSIEFSFYIFAYFILVNSKNNLYFIITIIAMSFFSIYFINDPYLSFYSFITRIWEFLFGSLSFFLKDKKILKNNQIVNFSTFIIIISFLIFDKETFHPGQLTLLPVISSFIIMMHQNKLCKIFFNNLFLIFFGNISYSLFVWHYIVMVCFSNFYSIDNIINKLVIILISLVISLLNYKFVEQKFRK